MNQKQWGIGGVSLVGVLSFLSFAPAYGSNKEIIVRLNQPQNTWSSTARWTQNQNFAIQPEFEVLNSSEGVVRLRFASEEEALRARSQLQGAMGVSAVAPNLLYRPQIKYTFKKLERKKPETFLGLPVTPLLSGIRELWNELPEVRLPEGAPLDGADPLVTQDWALKNVNLPELSSEGLAQITTAVIDTGIDYNHEDLVDAMWRDPADSKIVGYDFANDSDRPFDVRHFDLEGCLNDLACAWGLDQSAYLVNPGHGTHCAGHVSAVYNNSVGMHGLGISSRVIALKGFYDVGHEHAGRGDDAAMIKAIDYAIAKGAKVISASWGGSQPPEDAENSELKQALIRAQKAGVLVVIAAGNNGEDQEQVEMPVYPAKYDLDNLIVVAATDQSDELADFSNYGARSVHLGAPGVKILSTTVGSSYSDEVARLQTRDGRELVLDWDGTSMATPIVAGAVALVWAQYPEENYLQIRARILNNVRRVPGLDGKVVTGGVLDVAAALR